MGGGDVVASEFISFQNRFLIIKTGLDHSESSNRNSEDAIEDNK